jgi:hypothetical protein
MKTKKIAVYSLTAVFFLLMMLVYWLKQINTLNPNYSWIFTLLIFLLARVGGNIALIIFDKKMSAGIAAGIMAIITFPLLLIRSEVLFFFTLILWAPATTFLIAYSWFQHRGRNSLMNFLKIFAAGISALICYLSIIFMILGNLPVMYGGSEYAGFFFLALGIIIGCIEIIVMSIVLVKEYALQKDESKAGKNEKISAEL